MVFNEQLTCTEDCISKILERNSKTVFRLCVLWLKSREDAQDAFQDVFVKLFERGGKGFDSPEHEKAWLIRVTINHCKNLLYSRARHSAVPFDERYIKEDDGEKEDDGSEVRQAVSELPEKYRGVIYLFYFERFTTAQVAKALGIPDATVRTRLKRGREILKEKLKGTSEHERF